jgi:hypothetical protein
VEMDSFETRRAKIDTSLKRGPCIVQMDFVERSRPQVEIWRSVERMRGGGFGKIGLRIIVNIKIT